MKKQYEELQLTVFVLEQEIVRTSTSEDPFNDGYKDPNLNFGPPLIHGQHQLNAASPPRRARPPTCWLSEQRPRGMKDVT